MTAGPSDSGAYLQRIAGPKDGNLWEGSAMFLALLSRADMDTFMKDKPFYKNGLYERVLIERYTFGDRPRQKV